MPIELDTTDNILFEKHWTNLSLYMDTCSYVLLNKDKGVEDTFLDRPCHGMMGTVNQSSSQGKNLAYIQTTFNWTSSLPEDIAEAWYDFILDKNESLWFEALPHTKLLKQRRAKEYIKTYSIQGVEVDMREVPVQLLGNFLMATRMPKQNPNMVGAWYKFHTSIKGMTKLEALWCANVVGVSNSSSPYFSDNLYGGDNPFTLLSENVTDGKTRASFKNITNRTYNPDVYNPELRYTEGDYWYPCNAIWEVSGGNCNTHEHRYDIDRDNMEDNFYLQLLTEEFKYKGLFRKLRRRRLLQNKCFKDFDEGLKVIADFIEKKRKG